MVTTKTHVSTA